MFTRPPKVIALGRMLTSFHKKHKESSTHDEAVEAMFSLIKSSPPGWWQTLVHQCEKKEVREILRIIISSVSFFC